MKTPILLKPREILFEHGTPGDAEAGVCITLYNYDAYVVDALESAFDQTLERLGLVVLDDHSTDGGLRRVERWMETHAGRFARARLARHHRNAGLAAARNGAIELNEAPFAMVLDADNQLFPRCVERLLQSLRGSEFGFAYPIIEQFDGRSGLIGCASWSQAMLKQGNYIDAMALLRKEAWKRAGGYSRMKVGGWEDYDLWCKFAEAGLSGLFVPEILARYRLHGRSMLRTETDHTRNRDLVRAEMLERHAWLEL